MTDLPTVDVLVTDFGMFEVPPHIARTLPRVRRRKDGAYDRRYSQASKLVAWERQQCAKAVIAFVDGSERFDLDPFPG